MKNRSDNKGTERKMQEGEITPANEQGRSTDEPMQLYVLGPGLTENEIDGPGDNYYYHRA